MQNGDNSRAAVYTNAIQALPTFLGTRSQSSLGGKLCLLLGEMADIFIDSYCSGSELSMGCLWS